MRPANGAFRPSAIDRGSTGTGAPAASPACSAWLVSGLDRDDANAPGRAERGDDAADEPAAADGDGDDVGVGRVLLDLEPDRAGARDHDRVVERMHERPAALGEQLLEAIERLGRPRRLEVDRRSVAAGGRDLLLGGAVPHHDERVHPALRGGVRDGLGVVARRDRDHAARPLVASSERSLFIAPRTLNEPVRCRSSHLRRTPKVREPRIGVRGRRSPMTPHARAGRRRG